jgi:hypothetical protein
MDAFRESADADAELCKCKHPLHAHMNGLCIHGCHVETCTPEKDAQ